jgi:pimeloyl-ACP methyl ester carboxylesterase
MSDKVILLHGLFRTYRCMRKLERTFQTEGYQTLNIDYPSTRLSIEELVEFIHPKIQTFIEPQNIQTQKQSNSSTATPTKLHFVGHSLGGLVIRAYIHKYRPENLGRVVQLGSPNRGSEVADFLEKFTFFRWLYGPAGLQLTTDLNRTAHLFGPVDYELGIIAGTWALNPAALLIPSTNDGLVSVESTKLTGMKEHLVLPVEHTFFSEYSTVIQQVAHFLKVGSFQQ